MLRVVLVYKSGGVYVPDDVRRLVHQIREHIGTNSVVLTDARECFDYTIPLTKNWPGWWSKMELFNPADKHDYLFMDLDTMIVGNISNLAMLRGGDPIMLRDFYNPAGLQSSFMFIPYEHKRIVWDRFNKNPAGWMREFQAGGDQEFIQKVGWRGVKVQCWQDWVPDMFVSYKADVLAKYSGKVPAAARVVIFHGQPKPRDIKWNLDLEL